MQDRLNCRNHKEISQCYFPHVSQRYGEAKSISVYKSTPASILCAPDNISHQGQWRQYAGKCPCV